MWRAPRLLLTLVLTVSASSCTYLEDPELLQVQTQPIVNGANDNGHPEVGLLHLQGQAACTATLVGSRTVLTAAHCVTNDKQAPFNLVSPISFKIAGQMYIASQVVMHPGYGHSGGQWHADVAVVRLSQPVQGVAPARLATSTPHKGETITLVGYGYTSDSASSSFGVKRKATNTVGNMTQNLLAFYGATGSVGNICFGDSGGPGFAVRGGTEYLVGVHSYGDGACGMAEYDQRVDFYRGWIEQQAQGDLYDGNVPQDPGKDTQPPMVKILSPQNDASLGTSFMVDVSAQDNVGVRRVELFIDGNLALMKDKPPYSFAVHNLTDGVHNLRAEAVDEIGHRVSTLIRVNVQRGQGPDTLPQQTTGTSTDLIRPDEAGGGDLLGSCSFGGHGKGSTGGLWLVLGLILGLALHRRRRAMKR